MTKWRNQWTHEQRENERSMNILFSFYFFCNSTMQCFLQGHQACWKQTHQLTQFGIENYIRLENDPIWWICILVKKQTHRLKTFAASLFLICIIFCNQIDSSQNFELSLVHYARVLICSCVILEYSTFLILPYLFEINSINIYIVWVSAPPKTAEGEWSDCPRHRIPWRGAIEIANEWMNKYIL